MPLLIAHQYLRDKASVVGSAKPPCPLPQPTTLEKPRIAVHPSLHSLESFLRCLIQVPATATILHHRLPLPTSTTTTTSCHCIWSSILISTRPFWWATKLGVTVEKIASTKSLPSLPFAKFHRPTVTKPMIREQMTIVLTKKLTTTKPHQP